jgi:ferredoxin like protein
MENHQENKKMTLENKLALVKTKKDTISHIELDESICARCLDKSCLTICPAKTYEEINGRIHIAYENCLECGSCRVACPSGGIKWQNPRGRFGVTFLNG